MALENGALERLTQLERRVERMEPTSMAVAELRGDTRVITEQLKTVIADVGEIKRSQEATEVRRRSEKVQFAIAAIVVVVSLIALVLQLTNAI